MTSHQNGEVIRGALAGAGFTFSCTAPDLRAYAGGHLELLAGAPPQVSVEATLRWHDGQPPVDRLAAFPHLAQMERVDRDLYVQPGELQWFRVDDLRDLFLRFRWRAPRLTVEGDFFFRLANSAGRQWIRRVLSPARAAAMRRRRFTTLLYYLVYYPCWWWLEQTQDLHPIHAAGVETTDGVVLLAGASGVGKSTLAVALAALPGASLLSDSFVLHRDTEVVAVQEPVLLDAWSLSWLGAQARELRRVDGQFGLSRRGYHPPGRRLTNRGEAAVLVFPRRAPTAFVRALSATEACQRLSAADLIINDLRRYWAFAAVLEHLAPLGLVARREHHLARLTAAIPSFEVGLTGEMTSTAVAEAVARLIPTRRSRAMGSQR